MKTLAAAALAVLALTGCSSQASTEESMDSYLVKAQILGLDPGKAFDFEQALCSGDVDTAARIVVDTVGTDDAERVGQVLGRSAIEAFCPNGATK